MDEIGDKLLDIRQKSGPDSVYWLGSAKFTNEAAYLNRKLAAFWGTNNSDHQARICHSTTVTGVANTWGYGAMTHRYNDIRNAKSMLQMAGSPAEEHRVSLQHIVEGKELNRANMIVVDPRMTRTAAHATEYVRVRPGTHIATIYGMLWHIFENGWEDKEFLSQRVYGVDEIRKQVAKWTPREVERVTGLPEAQVKHIAEVFAKEKPATLIWAMGQTQFATGTANVRASCNLLLATGNVGHAGGGANIFRGHTNGQGATDLGLDVTTLPLYYGLAEDAWRHWCRVWEVDYEWMKSRFPNKTLMETPGIPSTRWFDATLLPKDQVSQPDTVQAMFGLGHPGNGVDAMPHDEHRLHRIGLADLVLRQQRGIEPARARNARCFHQRLGREAGFHPLVIHFPDPAPMSPRVFGKTVVERQRRHIETEIGGALHVGVATKYIGAAPGISDIAGGEQQDAARIDIRRAGCELGLSHGPDQRRGPFLGEDFGDMLDLRFRQTRDPFHLVGRPLRHLFADFVDAVDALAQEFLVLPAVFENVPKHPVDRGNMGAGPHPNIFGRVRGGPCHPRIDHDHVGAV